MSFVSLVSFVVIFVVIHRVIFVGDAQNMITKICGITRFEDAEVAIAAGANALGFLFWPKSPRFVDPFRARKIVAALPPFVTAVGVFADQPLEDVNGVAKVVGLGAVQLHGRETLDYVKQVSRPVMKAIGLGNGAPAAVDIWPPEVVVLLDVDDAARRGTGATVDWPAAAAIARRRRVVLAGGLTPANVADAIAQVRPFGVDVSSGVESAPGIKDRAKIEAFVNKVREASHANDDPARS